MPHQQLAIAAGLGQQRMAAELDLVASEWEECGEGARNMVLRYTGRQAPLVRLRLHLVRACSALTVTV